MATTVIIPVASDAHVNESAPTTNFATAGSIQIGESNTAAAVSRAILNFTGLTAGSVPTNAIVTGATLSVYANTDLASNASTVSVYRLKRTPVYGEVTWNVYSTGNSWTTAGAFHADDCEQTNIGSVALTATETLSAYKNIPLTASAVQEIVRGVYAYNHLLVRVEAESNDRYNYDSLEEAGDNYPILTLTYELPSNNSQIIII